MVTKTHVSALLVSLASLLSFDAFAAQPSYQYRAYIPGMRAEADLSGLKGWNYTETLAPSFEETTVGVVAKDQLTPLKNVQKKTSTLTVSAISGANPKDFTVLSDCNSISPGKSCEITFGFQPIESGQRTASVKIGGSVVSLTGVALAAETDPLAANTVVLIHADGSNGSTAFVDVKGHATAALGAARISTTSPKFGGGSIQLPSVGSIVTVNHSSAANLTTGDFTVEGWVNPTVNGGVIIGNYQWLRAYQGGWRLGTLTNGALQFIGGSSTITSAAGVAPVGVWTHFGISRSGTTLYLSANGATVGTLANAPTWAAPTVYPNLLRLGAKITDGSSYDEQFYGFIDDVRITVGAARYSGPYVVSMKAFPDN